MAYLDNTGLSYFWGKIKSALSSKQNKITASGPLQGDGNGNVSAAETTQAETIPIPAGILKGTASGGIEAATPGTDYAAPSLGLTGAAVGQAAAVKSVDADGKPTAWEPANFGNADVFIIDCTADGTVDDSMPITLTPSKTYAEVSNAILEQKQCYAQYDGIYYPLAEVSINAAESNNIVDATFTSARAGNRMRSIRMQHRTLDTDPVWSILSLEKAISAPEGATKGQVMAYQGGIRGWRNSNIGTNLSTAFSGLIKGSNGYLAQATPGVDYEEAPFTIHFTTDSLDENIISSDKSGAQIESAFNAGLQVEAFLDGKRLGSANTISNGKGYDFVDITANGNIRGVRLSIEYGDILSGGSKTYSFLPVDFSCVEQPSFSGANELWGTDSDGFWGLISHIALSNLPAVSAADNGKFLRVVNGAWAIAAIDNANGGSF